MKRGRTRLIFTGLWFLFGPVIGCMWLAAVNYSNNLVYAVLYLIAALCFISVFHTWRNLALVEVEHVRVKPAFAGEEIEVEIHLRNQSRRAAYNLTFNLDDRTAPRRRRRVMLRPLGGGGVNIEGNDAQTVTVMLPPLARGKYRFGNLVVRSAYPFGLFWATFRIDVGAVYYIYPEPRGKTELPELLPSGSEGPPVSSRSGDDFSGVRTYSPGESLRHIDWKAYARGRPLVVKQFTGGQEKELWLDARGLGRLPLEDKLSQLSLWALNAEESEIPYGLNLRDVEVPPALGATHQRRVMETLAVADRA